MYSVANMYISQEVSNALAKAVRDVLWFKTEVKRFLRKSKVPNVILTDAIQQLDSGTPTIKVVSFVLEQLESFGSLGEKPMRDMFTSMHNWTSFATIEEPRRTTAIASVGVLKETYGAFIAQRAFEDRKAREEKERQVHKERVARSQVNKIDHAKLQSFRDRFERIYILPVERERGDRFEGLMNEVFAYYTGRSEGAFRRSGEQIDGLFYFDNHPYYVEIRWKKRKSKSG